MPWPPIRDRALLERLALSHEAFVAFIRRLAAELGRRAYEPVLFERALAYPWERPVGSYVLRAGRVEPVDGVAELARGRHPVVAVGSNAAPRTLAAKFAHLDGPGDDTVLVLSGELRDTDIGAAAQPTIYGVLPATPFHSPGTAVRAAVLWLTPAQVTQLTWSEMTYRLGRLDAATFAADEDHLEVGELYAYASRFGTLHLDGEPVAMAAVPARGRRSRELAQRELLEAAAERLLGPRTGAEALVAAIWDDVAGVLQRAERELWPLGRPLAPEHWTPYPTNRGVGDTIRRRV